MLKNKTTNGFGDALNLDLNPLQTPNTVMTNALNATLVTMNGNELTLLNDMGNGRVETAYLPEGYIPLGSALLGGIIYIVSYNPLLDKSLIGSFPSPERNITSKESDGRDDSLSESDFYSNDSYDINTPNKRLDLTDSELSPGDKYLIYCSNFDNSVIEINKVEYNYISAYGETTLFNPRLLPRYMRFSIVSIASNGQIIDMTDSCVWLPLDGHTGYYFMSDLNPTTIDGNADVDDYRSLVTSNYNVFSCKSSGKLGILAQLECIDSFEITWDAIKEDNEWQFYFFTNWTYENDIEPDKINLYGLYVNGTINNESKDDYITINLYPVYIYPIVDVSTETEPGPEEPTKLAAELDDGSDPSTSRPETDITLMTTDIMKYQSYISGDEYLFIFCNPSYINSLSEIYDEANEKKLTIEKYLENYYYYNEKLPRKNNDKDNQFLIGTPYTTNETSGILKLDITPTMPYGKLSWLTQSFSINLEKLGTGEIDLVEYRYYILDNNITLSWGLDAYPERNKKINKVDFTFYEIDEDIMTWIETNQYVIDHCKDVDGTWIDCETETTPDKSKYDEEGNPITDDSKGLSYWDYYYPKCEDCEDDYDENGECKSTDTYKCDNCKCKYSVENNYINPKFLDIKYDYAFTVEGKSSYSGHFTNNIIIGDEDSLLNDKVYLLQIKINYTGTDIIYYRIFYTEPIFNSYYYNDEYIDYAKIILLENLDLQFDITNITVDESDSSTTVVDEKGEKVTIPSFKDSQSDTGSIYYILNHYTSKNISFKPEGTVGYSTFDVETSFNIKPQEGGEEGEIYTEILDETYLFNKDEAKTDYITDGGQSSRTIPVLSIDPTWNPENPSNENFLFKINKNNTITGNLDLIVSCETILWYNKLQNLAVQYELSPVEIESYFIAGCGRKGYVDLRISNCITTYPDSSDWTSGRKDDAFTEIPLNLTNNIYDMIDKALNDRDVVCLGGYLFENDSKSPFGIFWGHGDINKSGSDGHQHNGGGKGYQYYIRWKSNYSSSNESDHNAIVLYAMRYSSDIILFTYGDTDGSNNRTWGGNSVATMLLDDSNWSNSGNVIKIFPPGLTMSTFTSGGYIVSDMAMAPFKNLYKPVTYGGTTLKYVWSIIDYVLDFYVTYGIDITVQNVIVTMYINSGTKIPANIAVNNLSYESPKDCTVSYRESKKVNNLNTIDSITNSSDLNFVIYDRDTDNPSIVQMNISSNSAYYRDGNTFELISYIPKYRTIGSDNDNGKPSDIQIRCTNGLLLVLNNPNQTTIGAVWYYEELAVAITNVFII